MCEQELARCVPVTVTDRKDTLVDQSIRFKGTDRRQNPVRVGGVTPCSGTLTVPPLTTDITAKAI